MSDVAGIVLHSILKDPKNVSDIWPKLKLQYFNASYSDIFTAITKYYNKFNAIPSFETLEITTRNESLVKKIRALSLLEVSDDIDINIALEALIDQFTQEEILDKLSSYVDNITSYDSRESILKLSNIVIDIEDKVAHSEEVVLMNDILMMDEEELLNRVPLGLNNSWDANTGGMALTELLMIGGHRGSGKTVMACNITTNQYVNGNVCLFFTIEMRAPEINGRLMSILSGVSNKNIKNQTCNKEELEKIAKVRSEFFIDSEEVFQDYIVHKNYIKFEKELISSKSLNPDNQIIIVDNETLTLTDIDVNIQKAKAKHGDKLKVAVVDYMNQVITDDLYDWKEQIIVSKKLKELAAKHGILMVTPYQTDTEGKARFSRGILIPPDVAMILEGKEDHLHCKSTKTRGMSAFEFNAPIDWETLKISSKDYIPKVEESEGENARDLNNGS